MLQKRPFVVKKLLFFLRFSYPLVFTLPTEKVKEVDDDSGHHQDLDVVILPVRSLKWKKSFKWYIYAELINHKILFCRYFETKISYEKRERKMLMKLTTGVNFINILHAHFLYKSAFRSFSTFM